MTADDRKEPKTRIIFARPGPYATSNAVTVTAPDHRPTRREQIMLEAAEYAAAIKDLRDAERAPEDDSQ